MSPANIGAKTNHKDVVDGDTLCSLQQHLESSAFILPRDITHGASLPSATSLLGVEPRLQPTAPDPTEEPQTQAPPQPKANSTSPDTIAYHVLQLSTSSKRGCPVGDPYSIHHWHPG